MRAGRSFAWGILSAGAIGVLAPACSGKVLPAGGMMVAFSSDMAMPKDVDVLEVIITQNGVTRFQQDYPVGPTPAQEMPATLLVLPPEDPTSPVQIRVVALQSGAARILRDAVFVVPTSQVTLLRMPLDWLCEGSAANGPMTTTGQSYVPTQCPTSGSTCIAGVCADSTVAASSLPTFAPGSVFGGGAANGAGGTCFDTGSCFATATPIMPDMGTCTIPAPAGAGSSAGLNVAVICGLPGQTTDTTEGICGASGCLVPLDENSGEGWQMNGGRVQLPPAVCTKIAAGKAVGVTTTTTCAAKTSSVPTCGPWSSVTGASNTSGGGGGGDTEDAGFVSNGSDASGGTTVPDGSVSTSGDGSTSFGPPDAGPTPVLDSGLPAPSDSGSSTSTATIYASTDTELYSLDPQTNGVTDLGPFVGGTGAAITDLAVNAAGNIYVSTTTTLYQVDVTTRTLSGGVTFARPGIEGLSFTPANSLGAGSGEVLVGGDGNGELWSIDVTTGAMSDLGNFGPDPSISGNFLGLSGDLVFYGTQDSSAGLATIRSCSSTAKDDAGAPLCTTTSDFLAGVDMTALATAYTSGTAALSLNVGIYGGSSSSTGTGTGFGQIFGLAAASSSVFGFTRYGGVKGNPAQLMTISTTSGVGTLLQSFPAITTGWAGAGVSTAVSITAIPPPPPPPPK